MGFLGFGEIDPANVQTSVYRKVIATNNQVGAWYDDTMLAGTPVANLYAAAPLTASTLNPKNGIRHWSLASGETEHCIEWWTHGTAGDAPALYILADFVLFYPFVDCDSTDVQEMDNTVTLPRHTSGESLRAMIVTQNSAGSNGVYEISYTNQNGVSGRISSGTTASATAVGQLLTSNQAVAGQHAPFIPLQSGDTGIRSIDSITWTTTPGGLAAIVLVKTITMLQTIESASVAESQFHERMPEIPNGAYLGVIRNAGANMSAAQLLVGQVTTIKEQ